ncbi:primosomal protein N' family DNA-binding protein [Calidifontibacter terrae]
MGDEVHPATVQQLELLHTSARRAPKAKPAAALAEELPIARVQLDLGIAHLDRIFEYTVPADLDDQVRPGVRVKVRFGPKDVSGFVVDRVQEADHVGTLRSLRTVVSDESVLTPAVLGLCRAVAATYAGSVSDVTRLAVPPRHARAESALPLEAQPPVVQPLEHSAAWERYPAGPTFLRRVAGADAPAASLLAIPSVDPSTDWPQLFADAAQTALAAQRGVLITVPDHRDVERVAARIEQQLGKDAVVRLTADQGPQARYTAWLKVLRGHVRCVVGNRAAAFAPVRDLGLILCWDDGDDLLTEPRAPYPRTRDVLLQRHRSEGAALVYGGYARSVAVEQLLRDEVVRPVEGAASRSTLPRITVGGDEREVERQGAASRGRLPVSAWKAAHRGLAQGPVLVVVPRRGYVPRLRCTTCRTPAACTVCHGPLQLPASEGMLRCAWCDRPEPDFRCPECHDTRWRASVVGARRTAEELGRAFPGVPVIRSGGSEVLATVSDKPALVIATPGAEPVADGGYRSVVLLDGWAMTERQQLGAGEQATRQWLAAAALCRPVVDGGEVVLAGIAADHPIAQTMVRWAPGWFTAREYDERATLDLPPTTWTATVVGPEAAVKTSVDELPGWIRRFGPAPLPDGKVRLLLRADHQRAAEAAEALRAWRMARSLAKVKDEVSARVDPDGATL